MKYVAPTFLLLMGLTSLILSGNQKHIDWLKKISTSSDLELKKRERLLSFILISLGLFFLIGAYYR